MLDGLWCTPCVPRSGAGQLPLFNFLADPECHHQRLFASVTLTALAEYRVNWSGDSTRTRRLSPSAVDLLMRLSVPGAYVRFEASSGQYLFYVGSALQMQLRPKTVECLAAPRLIARERVSDIPTYTVTDKAREIVAEYMRARCEASAGVCGLCPADQCAIRN
jgi:hypothetical protein